MKIIQNIHDDRHFDSQTESKLFRMSTGCQTDKQTVRHTDIQTVRRADRQKVRQTEKQGNLRGHSCLLCVNRIL